MSKNLSEIRFIHAADIHLDSPLKGLESYEGAPVERIRGATRKAFERLIDLAVEEQVDFLLIAGDLFDRKWPDMSTGLWTAGQFRRLAAKQIPVYLIRGNHDAAREVAQRIRWPDNVHELSCDRAESLQLPELPVTIHGQGFDRREVLHDLAADYPPADPDRFNIGLLHTSLTGDPAHDRYAPTSEEVLRSKGYDYWALGHIHQRRTVSDDPFIGYCGNTQGRHINEPGERGCLLVSVSDRAITDVSFHPTDVLRWHLLTIELQVDDTVDDLFDQVRRGLQQLISESDGRFCAVRIEVSGSCAAHGSLTDASGFEEALAEIRNLAAESDQVWIEKVRIRTTPPIDLDQLRRGSDLMGDLLKSIDRLKQDAGSEERSELTEVLEPLLNKAAAELSAAEIQTDDPDRLVAWLEQAERRLVTLLAADERQ